MPLMKKDKEIHLNDYKQIDTSLVSNLSNKELVDQISCLALTKGWGLIAEACKRLETTK